MRVAGRSAPTLASAVADVCRARSPRLAVPRFPAQPLRVDPACVRPPADAFKRHDHARPGCALRGGSIRVKYRSRVKRPPSQSLLHTLTHTSLSRQPPATIAPPRGDLRRRLFAGQTRSALLATDDAFMESAPTEEVGPLPLGLARLGSCSCGGWLIIWLKMLHLFLKRLPTKHNNHCRCFF